MGIVSAIGNGVIPYLAGRLFDAIIQPFNIFGGSSIEMPLWLLFIILWIIIRLITDVIDWIINIRGAHMEEFIHSDYIINSLNILLELPISFHKDKKMGEVADKINRAANWISRISSDVIIGLSPQFLSVFVALAVSFYVNYFLSIILIGAVVIYIIILIKIAPPLAVLQRKSNRAYGKAFADSYDAIFNVVSVKQAVAEKY